MPTAYEALRGGGFIHLCFIIYFKKSNELMAMLVLDVGASRS